MNDSREVQPILEGDPGRVVFVQVGFLVVGGLTSKSASLERLLFPS